MYTALVYALWFVILLLVAVTLSVVMVLRGRKQAHSKPRSMRQGMRTMAGTALLTASGFLLTVAILLNSWPLFYMSTAALVTLLAARVQAPLAVRGLRFERFVPEEASVGEMVLVEIIVWSDRRIRRPLVLVEDKLPSKMAAQELSGSLPIAPAFDAPIRTQYRFRPGRRGRFTWDKIEVQGTDALGLITLSKTFKTEPSSMLVVPTPVPLDLDVPAASGFGIAETETGMGRGAGIEPRGIREYGSGDSIRYIHWASSARMGKLMVKEFETGSNAAVVFVLPRHVGSDIGEGKDSSLELMCSHVAYLAERMLRAGVQVLLPLQEGDRRPAPSPHDRCKEVLIALAGIEANAKETLSHDLGIAREYAPMGTVIYVLVSEAEEMLPLAVREVVQRGYQVVALLYEPSAFAKSKLLMPKTGSPLETGYREALRQAGAHTVEVPC